MLMLAFESSAKPASVALLRDGGLIAQYSQYTSLTHSRTLLPMAEALLKNCDIGLGEIDLYAVAHGPGSFTGIRIGVSTVKGLAWASGKPCTGVSTLEAMAWNGVSRGGTICPVMDARRSQVYNALFEIKDGKPERLCDDRPISLQELAAEIRSMSSPVFITGDGSAVTAEFLSTAGIPFDLATDNLIWQNAWGVGMAALGREPGDADSLKPVYLRLSQAERERLERLGLADKTV